ncbi:MAG: hypothetical protein ABEJ65_12895 [bacterium]
MTQQQPSVRCPIHGMPIEVVLDSDKDTGPDNESYFVCCSARENCVDFPRCPFQNCETGRILPEDS